MSNLPLPDDGEGCSAAHDKAIFGAHFVYPYKEYPLADVVLIADIKPSINYGRAAKVYVKAMPARYYTVVSEAAMLDDDIQPALNLGTGSGPGMTMLAYSLAIALSAGMLTSATTLPDHPE